MSASKAAASSIVQQLQTGRDVAALLRPQGARLSVVVFFAVGAAGGLPAGILAQGIVLIVCCYGLATIRNDLRDVHIDRYNGRRLPLADGRLGAGQARAAGGAVAVLLMLALAVRPSAVPTIFVLAYCLLGWMYSDPPLQCSRRGLLATGLLALCYAVLPFELAWQQEAGKAATFGIFVAVPLALAAASYVLYKDFKDEAGDRAHGKHTPLVLYGSQVVRRLSLACGLAAAGIAFSLAPTPWSGCVLAVGVACLVRQYRRARPSLVLLHTYALSILLALLPALG